MADLDPELERDIGYALSQSAFKVKGQRIESLRLVAVGVVRHLLRAGWVFRLREPEALHGPSLPPVDAASSPRDGAGATPEMAHGEKRELSN